MKKFTTILSFVALFALLAASVSALQLGSATIGGEDQDRIRNASKTFTVTNNETSSVTLTFASTADAKYNVRFEPATVTLTANETKTITIYADIPLDLDAVETSASASNYLEPKIHDIGDIQAKSGSTVVATSDLKMQAVNQLQIKNVRIECSGDSESVDDGDKIEDLKPDSECSFEVEIESKFNDDDDDYEDGSEKKIGDIDFDEVTVLLESDDLDVDEDPETDLSADETSIVDGKFEIEDDADDGTYTLKIQASGEDDNGAIHGEEWTVRLEVNRLSHDVQIRSPTISPNKISACDGGTVRIVSRISNLGTRDEDEVAVELDIPDLKFIKRFSDMELDSDDSTSVNFAVDVPAKAKPGVYRATLSTFFDNIAPSNSQVLEFAVEKCEEPEVVVVPPAQQQNATVAPQADSQTTAPTGSAVAVPRARVTSTGGFADSATYLWVLGGAGIVLLAIIIVLLVIAFRRPRREVL